MAATVPARIRVVFSVVALLLFLSCSGFFSFDVEEFEPLSTSLQGSETNAGYQSVALDNDWTAELFRVERDGVTVWFDGGGQGFTGPRGIPGSATISILIENASGKTMVFKPLELVLVPTRVRPWRRRLDLADRPSPLQQMYAGPDSREKWAWDTKEKLNIDSEELLEIKPGETIRVSGTFQLPARLKRGYADFTLRDALTGETYAYRFRIKMD